MYRLVFFPLLIVLLFTACGPEPTPREKARDAQMAAMRAKLRATHGQRFANAEDALVGNIVQEKKIEKPDRKDEDDPTAYVYDSEVLTFEAEKEWIEAGISNAEYPQWAALGMSPDEVKEWKALGISYVSISVFKEAGYTPQKTTQFLTKKFPERPRFYKQFGTPVYEFDSICEGVIKRQAPPFAYLEEKCIPYMQASHKNEAIGHLLDETKIQKGPLALEYLAELRRLEAKNSEIQSGMEVSIEEFIEDEDKENFIYLFPLLKTEPTDDEMNFIRDHSLPLEKVERYFSYQNPQYWIKKAAAEDAAKKAAAHQEAVLRAKEDEEKRLAAAKAAEIQAKAKRKALKEKQAREKALEQKELALHRQKAEAACGTKIAPDQLSKKEVYVDGKVVFTVEEHGNKMFGYGVQSSADNEIYFIRDPKDRARQSVGKNVTWILKTMGRTEALSQVSKKEYVYDKKSKSKFTMALFIEECRL